MFYIANISSQTAPGTMDDNAFSREYRFLNNKRKNGTTCLVPWFEECNCLDLI